MATRMAVRYVSRRFSSGSRCFSSGGKVLSEEEKAAENVYIKKMEQEKLEKLARKGPTTEGKSAATSSGGSGSGSDAKPSGQTSSTSSAGGVSGGKYWNYAVIAGVVTGLGALGWYMMSKEKKTEEVHA